MYFPSPSTPGRRSRRIELLLLGVVLGLQLGIVGLSDRLPFQDLPLHLENTAILAEHLASGPSSLERAFEVELGVAEPNLVDTSSRYPWRGSSASRDPPRRA